MSTRDNVRSHVEDVVLGRPLVSNMYRGLVAEAVVRCALPAEWMWCAADWAGWDFEHRDGVKLEVKQSAALQTWSKEGVVTKCRFGIAPGKLYLNGATTVRQAERRASLYVFSHHAGTDVETTDHRDPEQWRFFCMPASVLPRGAQTIGLGRVMALSREVWADSTAGYGMPCSFRELADVVEALRLRLVSAV